MEEKEEIERKQEAKHTSWVKKVMILLAIGEAAVIFIGIQFIPYGRGYNDPPVKAEPKWDSPNTRELFFRACGDCHSNATAWPWYGYVAPISWLIQRDIDKGRAALNVSEWGRPQGNSDDAAAVVQNGAMPPTRYTTLHPSAKLTDSEKQALIPGLVATFGSKHKSEQESKKKVSDSIRFFPVREDE
jgi:mono/diheme cytochrome c family protein